MNFIVGFQGMRKFYVFAFFSMLTMISGCAVFDGRNASVDDGKIVAGNALPSAQHEFDDSSDVKEVADNTSSETSASKDESKTASVESKLVDNSADEPDNTSKDASENRPQVLEEETKPLVDKITEETPDETRKMPEIRYLSDEEFIASMEQVGSAKTTPVETEELDITSSEVSLEQDAPSTKPFEPSVTYQLDTFYFANGSSFLDEDYRERIRKIVRTAKKDNAHIRVVGHASSRTNDTDIVSHKLANFKVSQKRAEAVARELRRAGMPADFISIEAMSDSAPAYLEVMPEGERLNRRVEVFISY